MGRCWQSCGSWWNRRSSDDSRNKSDTAVRVVEDDAEPAHQLHADETHHVVGAEIEPHRLGCEVGALDVVDPCPTELEPVERPHPDLRGGAEVEDPPSAGLAIGEQVELLDRVVEVGDRVAVAGVEHEQSAVIAFELAPRVRQADVQLERLPRGRLRQDVRCGIVDPDRLARRVEFEDRLREQVEAAYADGFLPKTRLECGISTPAYFVPLSVNGPSWNDSPMNTVASLPSWRRVVPSASSPASLAALPEMSMPLAPVSSTNQPTSISLTRGRIISAPRPSQCSSTSGDRPASMVVRADPLPSPIATGRSSRAGLTGFIETHEPSRPDSATARMPGQTPAALLRAIR